jgi:hypothetical protein
MPEAEFVYIANRNTDEGTEFVGVARTAVGAKRLCLLAEAEEAKRKALPVPKITVNDDGEMVTESISLPYRLDWAKDQDGDWVTTPDSCFAFPSGLISYSVERFVLAD